jgi:hypothetical protein
MPEHDQTPYVLLRRADDVYWTAMLADYVCRKSRDKVAGKCEKARALISEIYEAISTGRHLLKEVGKARMEENLRRQALELWAAAGYPRMNEFGDRS